MSGGIELTGMVLRAAPAGEYDRRVVLLTKERGRITAFARGARRQGSALLGATSPLCFGTFTLYEGRNAYTLVKADITNYFRPVRDDLEGSCYGQYFAELAEYYGRENLDASMSLNLLYAAMLALQKPQLQKRLGRYVFEIRMLVINGEFPQDEALKEPVSDTAKYTLQFIFSRPLPSLFSFTLSEEVLEEIARLQDRIREKTIDRPLKSLSVLEAIICA